MKTLRLLSVAILLAVAGCEPVDPEMIWWNVDELRGAGYVDALQSAPAGSRVEYRYSDSLLHIVTPGVTALTDSTGYNFSHKCPPTCP
jgi:hypothetical protein